MSKAVKKREEIPVEKTWDLEAIYASSEEWEASFQSIKSKLPELQKGKGTLGDSPASLLAVLQKSNEITEELGKLYTYAHMRYDQDTTNSIYQGLNDRAMALAAEVSQTASYIVPELLSLEEETIYAFLEQEERLQLYKQMFAELNEEREHVLSESEESILAQASEAINSSSQTFGMLNNADMKFPEITDDNGDKVEVTHGRYLTFLESSNRRVREEAFKAVYETYGKFKNTFASTLSGQVKRNRFYAKVRKYDSARQAALSKNHIPEVVYDQLVESVNKRLDLLHRYVRLRKKVLGVEELHMYDLYTPLVSDVEMEISYEEAKELVAKGAEPLGEEYVSILKEGFEKRWVDVEENVGKRSGAYSSGAYGTMPYILMNWQDNVNNLFTLAHEFGHSMHSYYTRENQPYVYGDYTIFVAEVASTVNEALLNDYLVKETDDRKKKLYLLNHFLEGFRGTVFRQTMFAEFEQLIHEKSAQGEALTPELLSDLYYGLNKKYFGDELTIDKEIALEWARIPHFYYNFYVYQYATGYSAAAALSKQILEEGEPAVKRYIEFLKAGSSDYPIEVLKNAGVDMTSSQPIDQALDVFEETLTEMEQLLSEG
ncbi:oligoendopeptidase F [Halalkalibacter hemicellulosilyticus]|uniref:Oligopeptidase F n=1 Tax=Halalkalibacter hemicellulosilyticusJCM 9152 TaxID=1236971 RepID=W4QHX6_9BACI|nr:oligoendopeptidase F [Halalkalibacter hemicellulosilyticus]GAE31258.1 oligoendopeptidase F [Halalkalibacter hemicellulosilyticusJCM 9152]